VIARVRQHLNMYYLGPKSYGSLARYTAHFDIATIPFVLNRITHATSPVKLFELWQLIKRSWPHRCTNVRSTTACSCRWPEGVCRAVRQGTAQQGRSSVPRHFEQEAQANTWQARARVLRGAIEAARQRQANIPRRHMEG